MRGLFLCLFPELLCNSRNKHKNNTWVCADTVCHESSYIILFLTQHNKSINNDKNDNLSTSSPYLIRSVYILLMTLQSIADDVTITRQSWRDHVNSDIWLFRYQFYSRDIHSRSCKHSYYWLPWCFQFQQWQANNHCIRLIPDQNIAFTGKNTIN